MDVKLYYIEGISRTDTPYFAVPGTQATLARQTAYFATKLVRTVSTSFYPPHYTNEIKFDTDDIDFDDTVNYLSLTFRNKTYYYFIDDIEYLNEGVIKLYVTMDTIQTYMFDIRIASGVIERKFINRWTDSTIINRNYIRENLSKGIYNGYYNYTRYTNGNHYVIAKGEDKLFNVSRGIIETIDGYNTMPNLSPLRIYSAPLRENANISINGGAANSLDPAAFVRSACKNAFIFDVYVIPFNPFADITDGGDTLVSSGTSVWYYGANTDVPFSEYCFTFRLADGQKTVSKVYSEIYNFDFTRNTSLSQPFNKSYVPALLDENYIKFEFGSKNNNTTFPLYYLSKKTVYCKYFADVLSGSRFYFITDVYNDNTDKYCTMAVDASKIGIEMLNDAWNNYVANNRARWIGPIAQTAKNVADMIITKGFSGATRIGAIGKDMTMNEATKFGQVRNAKGQFARGIKRLGKSRTASSRTVFGEIPTGDDGSESTIKSALAATIPITSQLIEDSNKQYAPGSIIQSGDLGDVYSQACVIYSGLRYVNDIEQCAQYYHRNGYLINEYVNNIDDIFAYVFNRYYYNVLKMSLPEVHLVNVIEDQTTIDSIVERLESGVRLWNNNATVINYTEYTDPTYRPINGGSFTVTVPYKLVSGGITVTGSIVPGSGEGSFAITNVSYYTGPDFTSVSYSVSGGGSSGTVIEITINGVFTQTVPANNIGNFTYDNVEIDYLP